MKVRAIKRRHDARTLQQAMAERAFFDQSVLPVGVFSGSSEKLRRMLQLARCGCKMRSP